MIAVAIAAVLLLLSALHLFWAFGGRWGIGVAVPIVDGRPAFEPSAAASIVVAIGLACAALVALTRGGLIPSPLPDAAAQWMSIALAAIFFARAVGDFRLVGFFKRVRRTRFATWDTRLFSPLCLLLACGFLAVAAR